jgi:hypothetical protein
MPLPTQSITFPITSLAKIILNQKEARLWCIAPAPRNRFPLLHRYAKNIAALHAFALCQAMALTFLLPESAGKKRRGTLLLTLS